MNDVSLNPMAINISQTEAFIIGFATSAAPGRNRWTELAVYSLPDASGRAFLSEITGRSSLPGEATRRKRVYVGTIERALEFFDDDSDLAESVRISARDWHDRNADRVKADVLAQREAERASREARKPPAAGYQGTTLLQLVSWLYGDAQAGKAARLAEDFGVPRRTVAHALDQEQAGEGLTGWAKAFVSAMRWFDRDGWQAAREAADVG